MEKWHIRRETVRTTGHDFGQVVVVFREVAHLVTTEGVINVMKNKIVSQGAIQLRYYKKK